MHYLTSRKGSYYLRVAIPRSLQPHLKQAEIVKALNTSNRQQAKVLALHLSAALLLHFERLKQMVNPKHPPSVSELLEALTSGRTSEFEGKANLRTGEIGYKTDAGLTGKALEEDHKLGLAWQKKTIEENPQAFGPSPISLPQETFEESVRQRTELLQMVSGANPKNLHSAVAEYIRHLEDRNLQSVRHYKDGLDHFVKWITNIHPNISVHKIRFDHLRDYRKVLQELKSHKKPFKTLHPHTVLKRMGFVEAFFKWCQKPAQGYYRKGQENLPTFDLKGVKPDYEKSGTSYQAFTQDELEKLFNIANWTIPLKTPYGFWMPLLGLYTGASTGELLKLNPNNINNHNNEDIWTIYFDDRTKNKNSKRTIPIHQNIIDLGFLEYLKDLKNYFPDADSIFPFPMDMDKQAGKTFRQLLERIKIKTPRKVFHSFSKNVASTLAHTSMPQKYQEHYIGHLSWSIHVNIYAGQELPLAHYKSLIDAHLRYKLDLSAFKYKKGMFEAYLKKQAADKARIEKFGHK